MFFETPLHSKMIWVWTNQMRPRPHDGRYKRVQAAESSQINIELRRETKVLCLARDNTTIERDQNELKLKSISATINIQWLPFESRWKRRKHQFLNDCCIASYTIPIDITRHRLAFSLAPIYNNIKTFPQLFPRRMAASWSQPVHNIVHVWSPWRRRHLEMYW